MKAGMLNAKRVNDMPEHDLSGGLLKALMSAPVLRKYGRVPGKYGILAPKRNEMSEGFPTLETAFNNLSKYTSTGRSTGEQVVRDLPKCPGYDDNL